MSGRGSRPLRVLMLTGFPAIGGPLPKLAPLMADGLRRCGCAVAIMGWSAHTAGHEPLSAKVFGRAADLVRVHCCLRSLRPDVVYVATSHNWRGLLRDVPLALSVRSGRPPLVVHLHGSQSNRLEGEGNRLLKVLSRILARRAAAVLLLSTEEQVEWQRFASDASYEVAVNPFVPAVPGFVREPRPAGQTPTVLTVARLTPEKGVFDLLDAFAMVRRERLCRLVIAGRGPAAEELARRATLMGIDDSVELLGYVSGADLDRVYREADVFVLPSYFEGFPVAVTEAMGYSLPVITTRIRGCADHLVQGEHVLFVPPRRPEVLAGEIRRLLDDDKLREQMGRANLVKVATFAPDRVVPPYADVMRTVAANGTHTA